MNKEKAATLLIMQPPLLPTGKRSMPKDLKRVSKKDLVQNCESKAVHSFRNRFDGKKHNPNREQKFIEYAKKSPSVRTVDFAIILAVEAGWHKALEELLSVDLSTYKSLKSDSSCQHPLKTEALSTLNLPPASGESGRSGYANAALLYAIVSGKVEAVRIMAKYMDVNIDDVSGESLLHYVYLLGQPDVRRQILDIVVPKLEPSINNLCMIAEQGDLESTKCLVRELRLKDRSRAVLAGKIAILNGHDDVAKWIVEKPGVIDWETTGGYLVSAAVERNNLGMVEYLSTHSPAIPLKQFGYGAAANLWTYLQRVNRTELFGKFIPSHPEGYSLFAQA